MIIANIATAISQCQTRTGASQTYTGRVPPLASTSKVTGSIFIAASHQRTLTLQSSSPFGLRR